jgi:bifunctional non-homologous end joining protein LigD
MPKKTSGEWTIDGQTIEVSSLDRLYWPDDKLTKGDALDYYRAVAEAMLPYLHNRPMTLRAYPNGIKGPGFWRRDRPDNAPEWIHAVSYQPGSTSERIDVPIIDDEASLVWFANHGSIEVHQWMSLADDLEHPDWAVFDLDPGDVEFERILEAAILIRDELDQANLQSFVKTSGGSGLHLFVTMPRTASRATPPRRTRSVPGPERPFRPRLAGMR